MEFSAEEWFEIKEWLHDLCAYYGEQAEIYKGYRQEKIYNEEISKINDFLESKSK